MSTSNEKAIGELVDKMVSMARQDTLNEVSKVIRKLMDVEWEETCDTDTVKYAIYYQVLVEVNKLWHKGEPGALARGLAQSARGETVDLGDFSQYLGGEE